MMLMRLNYTELSVKIKEAAVLLLIFYLESMH